MRCNGKSSASPHDERRDRDWDQPRGARLRNGDLNGDGCHRPGERPLRNEREPGDERGHVAWVEPGPGFNAADRETLDARRLEEELGAARQFDAAVDAAG